MSKQTSANLVISLDFELHWGVFDHLQLDAAGRTYFDRTRQLIPEVLDRFSEHGIHATWATVGMLFARDREQLLRVLPEVRPSYSNPLLNPYGLIAGVGKDEKEDPYHFATSLIQRIADTPGQWIGSHTFSHYYCLEPGQTSASFSSDLGAARRLAKENFGIELQSLVFPRNQYAPEYLSVIRENGFTSYRTNPDIWFWSANSGQGTGTLQKAARLLDHYVPLDADSSYRLGGMESAPTGIPASRFLRPYLPKLDGFGGQQLKVARICREMTQAAKDGSDYHLWWHPHNLATHPAKNMEALNHILAHFTRLRKQFGMQSKSMEESISPLPNA